MSAGTTTYGARHSRTARSAAARSAYRTRRAPAGRTVSQVDWDRKFRIIMLCVFALVAWIGFSGVRSLLAAHSQSVHEHALVSALATQNHRLLAQQRSLRQPATIERDARSLGMVGRNEQAYVITGLPGH